MRIRVELSIDTEDGGTDLAQIDRGLDTIATELIKDGYTSAAIVIDKTAEPEGAQ